MPAKHEISKGHYSYQLDNLFKKMTQPPKIIKQNFKNENKNKNMRNKGAYNKINKLLTINY